MRMTTSTELSSAYNFYSSVESSGGGGGNMTYLTDLDLGYTSDITNGSEQLSVDERGGMMRDFMSTSQFDGSGTGPVGTVGGPAENQTWTLPIDMQFNQGHVISIVFYSILMCVSAIGNITVLATIVRLRMKARLNRVNLFLLHLAVADLIVTFMLMPLEIGWAVTVSWKAGDATCRIMSFFRIFGLYLSGFILVCISLDRYFAVLKPLALPEANKRGRIMLYAAWTASFVCSLPQAVIFHVERHPHAQWFEQCVTFNFFSSPTTELMYIVFGLVFMYGFPLAMIILCYTCILYEIFKINNLNRIGENLRRSNMGALGRAKIRTLKMTVIIVATFAMLWMPYNCMSVWYLVDRASAAQVDQRVQRGLFIFACTNSCFNPMVYGLFHIRSKKPEVSRGSNNCRVQKIDKAPYKVRVRWRPRAECLCATSSSQMNSSSVGGGGRMGLRPLCEVNGRHVYLNGPNPCSPHQQQHQHSVNNFLCQRPNKKPTNYNPSTRYGNGNPLNLLINGTTATTVNVGGLTKRNNINAPRKSRRVKFVNLTTSTYHNKEIILNGTNFHGRPCTSTEEKNVMMSNGGGGGGGGGGGSVLFTNFYHRNSSSSYHTLPLSLNGSKNNSHASLPSLQTPDSMDSTDMDHCHNGGGGGGGLLKYFPSQKQQGNELEMEDPYTSTTFVIEKKL